MLASKILGQQSVGPPVRVHARHRLQPDPFCLAVGLALFAATSRRRWDFEHPATEIRPIVKARCSGFPRQLVNPQMRCAREIMETGKKTHI